MIRKLSRILILVLSAASQISCSLALLNSDEAALDGNCTVIISGAVSDLESNSPVTGIRITFAAYPENMLYPLPLITKTAYSDSNGLYSVEAFGFSDVITCKVTAESVDHKALPYEKSVNEILIQWSGEGFDEETMTFFVNNCNFQLKKTE